MSSSREIVAKSYPRAVVAFTGALTDCVGEISERLHLLFNEFRKGAIGGMLRENWLRLFEEWLERSQLPKFTSVVDSAEETFQKATSSTEAINQMLKQLPSGPPFDRQSVQRFVDGVMADMKRKRPLRTALSNRLWILYASVSRNFVRQTAHVLVSRLLLHRVGVDKDIFKTTGKPLPPLSHFRRYKTIREQREDFAPAIYGLAEFDWWYVSDIQRGLLSSSERNEISRFEEGLDVVLSHVEGALESFDLSLIDRDVWKEVYLHYLSEDERRRLGFVPTPDEVVELILDLVGYNAGVNGLCEKRLLDPATGSGTFISEAVLRLKDHLARKLRCHSEIHSPSISVANKEKMILEKISKCIFGIDIHPFASFLTTLNVLFQVLDSYAEAIKKYPDYSPNLRILTHDSLERPSKLQSVEQATNGRVKEAIRRTKEYTEISEQDFDFVVGNPPWGGVLRGKLGPLGNPIKRQQYGSYRAASGKYDICVLFIERGLLWLKPSGTLGMITQITYVDSAFGQGIREVIGRIAEITHFVDLSVFGDLLFPGFTNYPAITIMKRNGSSNRQLAFIKVD